MKMHPLNCVIILLVIVDIPCSLCDRLTAGERRLYQSEKLPTTPPGNLRVDVEMKNQSYFIGQTVKIFCEISGDPLPSYTWFLNGTPIANLDSRFNTKELHWGSRLRINNVRLSDSGVYKCEGSNQYGVKATSATITIVPGIPPTKSNRGNDDDYDVDDPVLEDEDDGKIEYHPDYDPRNEPGKIPQFPGDPGMDPVLGQAGMYRPPNVGPGNRGKDGYCQVYRGAACSMSLRGQQIYVTSEEQQGRVDKSVTDLITSIADTKSMSPRCNEFAFKALCYYAFPICEDNQIKPREICKDECETLESNICKMEFQLARSTPYLQNSALLPQCNLLADMGTAGAANCVRLGLPITTLTRPHNHQCYNGTGADYKGQMSLAESGEICLRWKDVALTFDGYRQMQYSSLGDNNFCRNPNNEFDRPWCFTRSSGKAGEPCNVPVCEGSPTTQQSSSKIIYVLPCVVVAVLVIIILVVICVCRRNKNLGCDKPGLSKPPPATEMNALMSKTAASSDVATITPSLSAKHRFFNGSALQYMSDLGDGKWGKVYSGEIAGFYGDNSPIKATIVVLPHMSEQICRELDLVADMRHPNIVGLLGVVVNGPPQCALYEDLSLGELKEYLMIRSPGHSLSYSPDTDSGLGGVGYNGHGYPSLPPLGYKELLHCATQVAAAMEYLASRRVIFKDLAARNCIVTENMTVKASDLGLGPARYPDDYYQMPSGNVISTRWAAPEVLRDGSFTLEADIFSFGVLLWEIFAYGQQPYYGFTDFEVMDKIRSRLLLPNPCTEWPVYTLMVECWNEHPQRRPSFKEVHTRLIQWKGEAITGGFNNVLVNYGPLQKTPSQAGSSNHSSAHNTNSTGLSNGQKVIQAAHMRPVPPPVVPQQIPPYPALYRKPSPPGSVTSHKSSAYSSPPSSTSGYKNGHPASYGFVNHQQSGVALPHPEYTRVDVGAKSGDNGMHIPDMRTTEI